MNHTTEEVVFATDNIIITEDPNSLSNSISRNIGQPELKQNSEEPLVSNYTISIIHNNQKYLIQCLSDEFFNTEDGERTTTIYPTSSLSLEGMSNKDIYKKFETALKTSLDTTINTDKTQDSQKHELVAILGRLTTEYGGLKPILEPLLVSHISMDEQSTEEMLSSDKIFDRIETLNDQIDSLQETYTPIDERLFGFYEDYKGLNDSYNRTIQKLDSLKLQKNVITTKLTWFYHTPQILQDLAIEYKKNADAIDKVKSRINHDDSNCKTINRSIKKINNNIELLKQEPSSLDTKREISKYHTLHNQIKAGTITQKGMQQEKKRLEKKRINVKKTSFGLTNSQLPALNAEKNRIIYEFIEHETQNNPLIDQISQQDRLVAADLTLNPRQEAMIDQRMSRVYDIATEDYDALKASLLEIHKTPDSNIQQREDAIERLKDELYKYIADSDLTHISQTIQKLYEEHQTLENAVQYLKKKKCRKHYHEALRDAYNNIFTLDTQMKECHQEKIQDILGDTRDPSNYFDNNK